MSCSSSSSPGRRKKPSEEREKAAPARSGLLLPDGTCYYSLPHFPLCDSGSFLGDSVQDILGGDAVAFSLSPGTAARCSGGPSARSPWLQPSKNVLGAGCWRTVSGSCGDSWSDYWVRGGLKYCYLMRGGGQPSGRLVLRCCASCRIPWETVLWGFTSIAGKGVKCPGKAEATLVARFRRGVCCRTLSDVSGTPCRLHRPGCF